MNAVWDADLSKSDSSLEIKLGTHKDFSKHTRIAEQIIFRISQTVCYVCFISIT